MKKVKFDTPQKALLLSLVFLFFFAASVMLIFWGGQRATAAYWRSEAMGGDVELDKRAEYMYKAARIEGNDDDTWRQLSQVLLAQVAEIATQEPSENEQENQQELERLGQISQNAIFAARNAKDIDGEDPQNWRNLGDVFLNLIPYAQGSADQAVSAYDKALKLDPNNPSLHLRKAQAKNAQAQRLARQISQLENQAQQNRQVAQQAQEQIESLNEEIEKLLKEAEKFGKKAIEVKANYSSAHMFLSNIYDAQGKMDEAISSLSNVVLMNPQNAGLYFQLGLLHYKKDALAEAEGSFRQALSINSEYANARYFLGLTLARRDKNEEAISQFEKVAENNPENEEVEQIISNLKEDKKPLAGIDSQPSEREQAPVEEEQDQQEQQLQQPQGQQNPQMQPQEQPRQQPQLEDPQQETNLESEVQQ